MCDGTARLARKFTLAAIPVLLVFPVASFAYRPFVSTDAAVADLKTAEIELGFFTVASSNGHSTYGVPGLRLNYGLATDMEVVGEFGVEEPPNEHTRIVDPGVSFKAVLREGVLQEREGLSVATEIELLLPTDSADEKRVGFTATGIISGKLSALTYHLNLGGGVDRAETNPLVEWGVIVEWALTSNERWRLAAEVNGESAEGRPADNSGLLGFICRPAWRELLVDVGARKGFSQAAADWGVTAGVTFSLPPRPLARSEV